MKLNPPKWSRIQWVRLSQLQLSSAMGGHRLDRSVRLSKTATAKQWLSQFSEDDRPIASRLLDAMLLLNEEQVCVAIRGLLQNLAAERSGPRKRVALYAEREYPERQAFEVQAVADSAGIVRRRAVGRSGPAAIKPVRGSMRVGSEGLIAFTISQAVEAWPQIFVNQPGPDRFRGARRPIGALVFVTDFIGSGARLRTMLDKFWAVPTVRAWASRGWVEFKIVAAAATSEGLDNVRAHRLKPQMLVGHIAPTVWGGADRETIDRWRALISKYGPRNISEVTTDGFLGSAALIAFSYRIPNNAPALIRMSGGGWKALYNGPAPEDLRVTFGLEEPERRLEVAAASIGLDLSPQLSLSDANVVLALGAVRGKWRVGAEVAIAEMTGLTVPELLIVRRQAMKAGLLSGDGRLTDVGQATLRAGISRERKRPTIPSSVEPYYPVFLRVPGGKSRVRRPSGRP